MISHQWLTIFSFKAYDYTLQTLKEGFKQHSIFHPTEDVYYSGNNNTTNLHYCKKITCMKIDSKINFNEQKVWFTKLFLTQILQQS